MKKILLPLVFGALAFPVFGCGNAALPPKGSAPSSYRHISQAEARKMMETQTGYILLDVRTRKEYDEGHIPDAICVPNEAIQKTPPSELPDKNQLILVYCRSGRRSKAAAQKLADMGYTNIIDFGGITGWQGELARTTAGDAGMETANGKFTKESRIKDVASDSAFAGYGRLLFPVQKNYMQGDTLGNLGLTWYTNIRPEETVEVVNGLHSRAAAKETIFLDIYTETEKEDDPAKRDTGLFLFKGKPGGKCAILCAGGGFRYVGAIHDSFPHAFALSRKGYNAFALIYRPGGTSSLKDLARAVAFIHENHERLGIDVDGYSLWGGSAGARMAAMVGALGTAHFGEKEYPKPAAVIMQYTGFPDVYGSEPPTYSCVGSNDGIALSQTMRRRTDALQANGTDAEIEVFDGLAHGFGLGTGTAAEGWIDRATAFWERQMPPQRNGQ